jgi:UDP-glucose 4-epimerase
LVADPTTAKRLLNWTPKRSDLAVILEDAWRWENLQHQSHAEPG